MTRSPVPTEFQDKPALATERQVSFIASLIDERRLTASPKIFDAVNAMDVQEFAAFKIKLKEQAKTLTKRNASKWIECLLALPKETREETTSDAKVQNSWPDVPAGRYALVDPAAGEDDTDAPLKFYKVVRPTEGKWEGYTFLQALAGGDFGRPVEHPIKDRDHKRIVLDAILAADPAACAQRYGQEIGECGVCGRTLTDETSRAHGIGPVCREQTGW